MSKLKLVKKGSPTPAGAKRYKFVPKGTGTHKLVPKKKVQRRYNPKRVA